MPKKKLKVTMQEWDNIESIAENNKPQEQADLLKMIMSQVDMLLPLIDIPYLEEVQKKVKDDFHTYLSVGSIFTGDRPGNLRQVQREYEINNMEKILAIFKARKEQIEGVTKATEEQSQVNQMENVFRNLLG